MLLAVEVDVLQLLLVIGQRQACCHVLAPAAPTLPLYGPSIPHCHALTPCLARWTMPALAQKFRIRRQRVMAILALKEIQAHK
jgi:hypothetical protein